MKKKVLSCAVCAVLALCLAVGATVAWLKDTTPTVTNTFTVGDVDIAMSETVGAQTKNTDSDGAIDNSGYKMVPGAALDKDPRVLVLSGSEACWLFVKVEKSTNFDDLMSFTVADGWTALTGAEGVYYRSVNAQTAQAGASYAVLRGDTVTVRSEVTKEQLSAIEAASYPTLTFTAYAIQSDNLPDGTDASAAWELVK